MLLNFPKIKTSMTTKLSLSDDITERYVEKLQDYFGAIESNLEDIDAHEVIEALSTLVSFKKYFASEEKWEHLISLSLEKVRQGIYQSKFHPFFAHSGIAHVAFTIQSLHEKTPSINRFMQSTSKLLAANIYRYLLSVNEAELMLTNNFELLYGFSGPLRYALCLRHDNELHNMAIELIEELSEILVMRSDSKKMLGHTITGWHYYPSAIEKIHWAGASENGCVNYGVSHGIGGPLLTLAMVYGSGMDLQGVRKAIDDIVAEYLRASYYVNDIIYWPGRITFEQQYVQQEEIAHVPNRMSWCYGSVGILRVLYLAATYISDKKLELLAINELMKIAKMSTSEYLLVEPNICHGLLSVALVMDEMYRDTKNSVFFDKVIELTGIVVNFIARMDSETSRVDMFNFLEGLSGMFQAIQSMANGCGDSVNRRLLII